VWPGAPTPCACCVSSEAPAHLDEPPSRTDEPPSRTDEPPSRTFLTARYFVQFSSGKERSSLAGRSGRPRTVLEFGDLGAQRPFGVAAFGDLTHDRRYPDDLAGVVAQQRDTELDRQPLPVAVGGWHAKELVAVAGVYLDNSSATSHHVGRAFPTNAEVGATMMSCALSRSATAALSGRFGCSTRTVGRSR